MGAFFLASSLACRAARALRSAASRSSAVRALPARSLTSRAARSCAAWAPAVRSSRIVRQLLLEVSQPLGDRGFDLEQFFAGLIAGLKRRPAGDGANLRPVNGDLGKAHQPFADQRRHALRQKPIEDIDLLNPKIGEPVMVHRHAPRQPAIGVKPRKIEALDEAPNNARETMRAR